MARMKFSPHRNHAKKRAPRTQRLIPALILATLLASCSFQHTITPLPMSTRNPVDTPTAGPQRSTAAPEFIDIGSGGFSLAIQPGLQFEAHDDSISISDQRGELVISLNGRPYVASSYTIQSFLGKYLAEMASRGGSFDQGEPYEIVIDGTGRVRHRLLREFSRQSRYRESGRSLSRGGFYCFWPGDVLAERA